MKPNVNCSWVHDGWPMLHLSLKYIIIEEMAAVRLLYALPQNTLKAIISRPIISRPNSLGHSRSILTRS